MPLQVPSAWHVLRDDPTRMKGALHWKKTSDLNVKLFPLTRPSAGIPGSPQNTAVGINSESSAMSVPAQLTYWKW